MSACKMQRQEAGRPAMTPYVLYADVGLLGRRAVHTT